METSTQKRLNFAWLVVVAITVVYLWIDHLGEEGPSSSTGVTVSAIALALVKYWLIMREFMDVRRAPQRLRRITDLLVVVIAASLLTCYFVGRATA